MVGEKILEFRVGVPKILSGKGKGRLVSLNTIPLWYRYQKTKIKNQFKDAIKDWFIPKSDKRYKSGSIVFKLYRPTKVKLDADGQIFAYKWIADALVEQGWFLDDDKITFVLEPVVHDVNKVETEIKVEVYANV